MCRFHFLKVLDGQDGQEVQQQKGGQEVQSQSQSQGGQEV